MGNGKKNIYSVSGVISVPKAAGDMVMIKGGNRVKKHPLEARKNNYNYEYSSVKKIFLKSEKLPNIGKQKDPKKLRKITVDSENIVETDRLPPLEPANVPLTVPDYLQQDEDSWDGLPDELDDYLDGRESNLSLGSLWSNQTDFDRVGSSLESWGEDEFDQAASKGVADMFSEIDSCLYEGTELPNNPTMAAECKDWSNKE